MQYFTFKNKKGDFLKFPVIWERLDKEPFAIKYQKRDGNIIPAIIFRLKQKVLLILFRYWRKKTGKTIKRILTEDKIMQLWKEGKMRAYTPLNEYMTEEEKQILKVLIRKLKNQKPKVKRKKNKIILVKNKEAKRDIERKIGSLLIKIGKRLNLHRIIIMRR